jgi:hypothetical protein
LQFEEIFSKYDKGNKGGLTISELNEMVRGNRNIMDPTGWVSCCCPPAILLAASVASLPPPAMLRAASVAFKFSASLIPPSARLLARPPGFAVSPCYRLVQIAEWLEWNVTYYLLAKVRGLAFASAHCGIVLLATGPDVSHRVLLLLVILTLSCCIVGLLRCCRKPLRASCCSRTMLAAPLTALSSSSESCRAAGQLVQCARKASKALAVGLLCRD